MEPIGCKGFIDLLRPDAVRILDFALPPNAWEPLRTSWLKRGAPCLRTGSHQQCYQLKHEGPGVVLKTLRALPIPEKAPEALQEHRQYLEKRVALMDYPSYRQQGYPIGSGSVESANKRVMQARLKGAGMRWERAHVNPMLALRTAVCNECWDESWQAIRTVVAHQRMQRRQQRAFARLTQLLTRALVLVVRLRLQIPSPLPPRHLPSTPPATLPGSWRPSPHHPWKRAIISPTKRCATT